MYYTRDSYQINYMDGVYVDGNGNLLEETNRGHLNTSDKILYNSDISSYNEGGFNYNEPKYMGYVFEGWYLDDACTSPCTFKTMPKGGITVYAKWRQVQYRVFLHPNVPSTDTSLDWGSDSQQMNFRISYGGTVSLPTGQRDGYELVGWYKDPGCTQLYSSDTDLNDATVTASYDKTVDMTDPMDKYGNGATSNSDADNDRFWITKKLDLYAKWRHTGTVQVTYEAGDGSDAPIDRNNYQDQAQAVAGNASTAPGGKHFQYWVVQQYDNGDWKDTDQHVYPGNTFKVDAELAHDTTPPGNKDKTYKMQLRAQYGDPLPMTKVEFMKNDGTDEKVSEADYSLNDIIAIPADPQRDGYEFLGWSATKEDEWTDEEFAQAKDTIDPKKTYAANNLPGMAWQDGTTKKNVLYACWKPKYVTLVIQKEMSGAQANLEKGFTFTVAGADGTSKEGYTATTTELKDSTADTPDSPAKDGQFAAVTELSKDRTTVRLRWGDKVTITEGDHVGYKTSYSVSNGNGTDDKKGTIELKPTRAEDGTYTTTVVWTNTKENTVVTGIKSAGVPGALTAVGAAALAIAGGFAYVRRDETGAGAHARRRGRR